jgi:hypothetical protein
MCCRARMQRLPHGRCYVCQPVHCHDIHVAEWGPQLPSNALHLRSRLGVGDMDMRTASIARSCAMYLQCGSSEEHVLLVIGGLCRELGAVPSSTARSHAAREAPCALMDACSLVHVPLLRTTSKHWHVPEATGLSSSASTSAAAYWGQSIAHRCPALYLFLDTLQGSDRLALHPSRGSHTVCTGL